MRSLGWMFLVASFLGTDSCDHHGHNKVRLENETIPFSGEAKPEALQARSLSGNKHTGERCGARSPTPEEAENSKQIVEDWVQNNGGRELAAQTYPIKVWFHVMKAGNTPKLGAWSRALANQAIAKVNYHYQNTPFVFTLAGMTQTTRLKWFQCPDDGYETEYQYKTTLRVEGADTLNIYMCDLMNSQGLYGSAWFPDGLIDFPEYDGINMANPFSGETPYGALDAYITLVHEIGHWLGLYHTFEGKKCRGGGDFVKDTPAHPQPSWDLEGWDTCFAGMKYNSCPDNVAGIDPGLDPLMNHMNYVDSWCEDRYGSFTNGQVQRMVALFEKYRYQKPTCRFRGVRCMKSAHCCSQNCRNQKCV